MSKRSIFWDSDRANGFEPCSHPEGHNWQFEDIGSWRGLVCYECGWAPNSTGSDEEMTMPPVTKTEQIENDFTYHAPKEGQPQRYTHLRSAAKEFALLIVATTPSSREQSLAITKLEEAIFWANAAIARNE